ncbi:MAG: hypothetical protein EPN37_04700 [Chitinophagaceae bacterium]|nr:MAG: hypothetical protein EPN37_04700 [Chitinophagaceae bacterium]
MRTIMLMTAILLIALTVHAKNNRTMANDTKASSQTNLPTYQSPTINDSASIAYQKAHNTGTLSDFPRMHPLVVHFPIVFIILAFIVQIISFFVFKYELSWVSLFLIVLGFIGAFIATNIFHGGDPDLPTLSEIARRTFEKHEQFAHYTEWISGMAAVAKIISHFVFKMKLWTGIIVAILMAGAVYAIHTTGDMGARLVHIDAIGVQGNKIPLHDTD